MDFDETETPSPFMDLPNEMWESILKKVTPKVAMQLRLVNTDLKIKVDNLYKDWVIKLTENYRKPKLDMILDLQVKKVIVEWFLKPLPNRPPGMIMKFPNLVTEIEFDTCTISVENLHTLLQYKNLKKMQIMFDVQDGSDESIKNAFWKKLDPQFRYDFPHLHTLELKIYPEEGIILNDIFFDKFMTKSKMPSLRSVKIMNRNLCELNRSLQCRLSSTIHSFLGRHGKTLKKLEYWNEIRNHSYIPLSPQDSIVLGNCTNLETMFIVSASELGRKLAKNQSKLAEIQVGIEFQNLSSMCAKMCARNFETLTKINISIIGNERNIQNIQNEDNTTGHFDVAVFGQCVNLKALFLLDRRNNTDRIELSNLFMLPEKIEIMSFISCLIYSEDLSKCLKSFEYLEHLVVDYYHTTNLDLNEFILNEILSNNIQSHGSLKYTRISNKMLR